MGALMRARDWASTPLGPPETWPQSLRTVVRILLTSRYQMWMGWGEDLSFFYNDAYRPTLGVKHEWALGVSARKVWEEIWPDIGPRIQHVLKSGEATWDEGLLLFLERSGYPEETYHTFSYSPLSNDGGDIVGMLCVVTEETERVIGERRLSCLRELASEVAGKNTSAEMLAGAQKALATNLRDLPFCLIYALDPNGLARLVFATGVTRGHLISPLEIPLTDNTVWPLGQASANGVLTKIDDLEQRFAELPTGAWPEPPRDAVIVPLGQQGQQEAAYFMVAGINPYRQLDPAYLGFINLVAGQISAGLTNTQAYEEERRRAEALAEIDRAKTTFFSNVSHEFRTPLTLMLSPLEEASALPDGELGSDARSLVSVAHRNGVRLLKLVNTLLDFSRIEAGRVTANYQSTELAEYTAELASNFRSAIDKAGLKLVIDAPPLKQQVYIDRDMWEKIVLNLLSNAFKFTFDGEIGIAVKPSQDLSGIEVSVWDTGTGIPPDELDHLFERFRRVEGAKGRSFEGSGIGLALVQELVKLHGGSIRVASKIDHGSTFTISIPFGVAHLPSDRLDKAAAQQIAISGRAQAYVDEAIGWLDGVDATERPIASSSEDIDRIETPATSGQEMILLADDNNDMREYVRRLLAKNYRVEAVKDGQAALEMAWQRRPDLILSDIMMPRLDGFGLLQALRNDTGLRDVPVILLSARAGDDAKVEGLDAGANDYLTKPFSARELLARVRANIDMAALRREALASENELRVRAELAQERAESILASINDGFMVFDQEWKFSYINAAAERLLGKKATDLIGRNHWLEFPATIGTPLETNYRRAMAEQISVTFENYYEPWDRWFDLRVYPSIDGSLSVYFQDITDRKNAEKLLLDLNESLERQVSERTAELRAKEARLRGVFGTSYAYQGFLALDGTLIDANATSLSGVGVALEDVVGLPFWETPWFSGTPGMPEKVRSGIAAAATGEVVRQEIHVNLPNGGWRWFDFQMRPVRDENGSIVGILPEAVEVTERRMAEETARQAQKMEAIGQLTGGVAHDFNNLLTVIRSSADLLRLRDLSDDRWRRYVDAISDTADRAAKLTSQLLAFARRHPVKRSVFDVVDRVNQIAEILKTVLGSRVVLKFDFSEGTFAVEADSNQFETVMINLAANARDAIDGQGSLTIKISPAGERPGSNLQAAGFVAVQVSDTGCGIPASQIERIFEPFFTTKEVGRGTGLGLSQVYGFVQQSGGTVTVDSKVGVGTTFTLALPLSAKPIQDNRQALSGPTKADARGRVLVVEDNAQVGEFSSQLLRDLGYHTVLASGAEEALRLIAETTEKFDVVFSDVVMPGLDGISLGKKIKEYLPDLPFVLTSGYSHAFANSDEHGFELLQKPYSVEELSRVLRRALRENAKSN